MPPAGSPLSFAQQRLWFVDQLTPGLPLYNIPLVFDLDGPLDPIALVRALEEIVRRHEPLRTVFRSEGGVPRQEVLPATHFPLSFEAVPSLPQPERDAWLDRRVLTAIRQPFDLQTGPVFRSTLLGLDPGHHILILVVHHIAFDGWSAGIFFRELAALYGAFSTGAPNPLPELALRYVDFAAQQRAALTGETLTRQLDYWRTELQPPLPRLTWSGERARPAAPSFTGNRDYLVLDDALSERIDAFCRAENLTLFMYLLGVYGALLRRLTGEHDLIVGTPIANRVMRHTEPLVGFFANSLALRLKMNGRDPFRSLLQHARRTAVGAYAHQDLPFERIVEELNPERRLSLTPIIQAVLVLDNTPYRVGDTLAAGPLTLRRRVVSTGMAKFDVTVSARRATRTRRLTIETNADIFEREAGARILGEFRGLLERVIERPDLALDDLAPPLERRPTRSSLEHRGTAAPYPHDATVHELFERRATAAPGRQALVDDSGIWTYGELDDRADHIARHLAAALAQRGVARQARVGLCLDRSKGIIAVLLGVLKAGCAYVPLDPTYPPARLAELVRRAGVDLVVTDRLHAECLSASEIPTCWLDDIARADAPVESEAHPDAAAHRATPDDLAYVLFTSGTSGQPKAVGVPHRAIVRLAYGMGDVPLGEGQTVLQLAPLAFDASTFEIWAPLLSGGRVAVAPELAFTAPNLAALIARHQVTVMWLTASLFNLIVDERPETLSALRYLLIGGEALSVPHVRRALAALPGTRLVNGYGPTEATTFSCLHPIAADDLAGNRSVPIGRPLANTNAYVLGPDGQPVADGEPGELWIGGEGLAVGYLNDDELTAARFVRDPFVDDERARMYRTGDQVRWLANGTLEFLGRLDDQIKVRGFRIEPGEVEAAIAQHPRVARVAVTGMDWPPVGASLVAFLVPAAGAAHDEGHASTTAEVRKFLGTRLPAHMVPTQWVWLEVLPFLPSGKVDRRALSARARRATAGSETAGQPSMASLEASIAGVWRDVLGVVTVAPTDNFFDLGGHSLLATQVVSRLQSVLGLDIDLRTFFESPTVEGLTRAAAVRPSGSNASAPIPHGRGGNGPLSFAQQRLWFLHHWFTDASVYNVPYAFRIEGTLDIDVLGAALQAVVDRHDALRTIFPLQAEGPVQRVVEHLQVALPLTDLSGRGAAEAERTALDIARTERARPFDLATGPLFRASLIRTGPSTHYLLLSLHHIVCDGWSIGLLLQELAALYADGLRHRPMSLPPLPLQYPDFAAWQRAELSVGRLEPHLAYWRRQLAPPLPLLDLPLDHPRPDETSGRGAHVHVELPDESVRALASLCRSERVTMFAALLGIFQVLLCRHSGQSDVVVGTPSAGRPHPDTENLIGCFINTLALRTNLSDRPTFRDLLRRVQQTVVDAQVHQDAPFEMIVDALRVRRDTGRAPIFQAMVTLDSDGTGLGSWPGLVLTRLPANQTWAKFEVGLDLVDAGGRIAGALSYSTDLFDRRRMERMAADYVRMVTAAVANPDGHADDVDLDGTPLPSLRHGGAGQPRVPDTRPSSAHGETERALAVVWQELLGAPRIGLDENFFDLGGNSMLAVRLVAAIERRFGSSLRLATLFREGTIRRQARLIDAHGAAPASDRSIVVPIQPSGTRPPFFLVHGISGEVISFQALVRRLGTDRPIYGLQADPAAMKGGACRTLEDLARMYVEAVQQVQPRGPYRLGGYSAGGSVAYEMARQLREAGEDIRLLLMLDAPPPGRIRPPAFPRALWRQLKNAVYWPVDDEFFRMDGRNRRARVGAWMRRMTAGAPRKGAQRAGTEPKDGTVDIRDRLGLWDLPEQRGELAERYLALLRDYRPSPYEGSVTLLRARTLSLRFRSDRDLGWGALARGGVTVHVVPGAHDTILREPRVARLADALASCLAASEA